MGKNTEEEKETGKKGERNDRSGNTPLSGRIWEGEWERGREREKEDAGKQQ